MFIIRGAPAPDASLPNQEGNTITLSHVWSERPCILLFLRHLGCTFCRKHVNEMQQVYPEVRALGGAVLAVAPAAPPQTAEFHRRLELSFMCFSEPEREKYRAYGLERGNLAQVAGPQLWWAGFRSVMEHGIGLPQGDTLQLHGTFVIARGGTVEYAHRGANSADLPTTAAVLAELRKLTQ